ncbi:MAG: helix-turn-helix domain-containing protein, partial [Flavonifractor sp.]|nr:helix-turn-helix domain-containing protein [Flavonifractor sp.]
MAVFRLERTGNFTVMANLHLRDKSLSLKAKGLLSQMLSLPEDWDYTLAGLASINAEGKDAIRSAVAELERAGYVTRSRERDKMGCWGGAVYVIREAPVFFESPAPVQPASGNPTLEKPTQLKTQSNQKTDLPNTDFIPSPSSPSKTAGVQGDAAQPRERKEWKRTRRDVVSQKELDIWREHIRENIQYEDFVTEYPYDAGRLDEMVEVMVEAVCSRKAAL